MTDKPKINYNKIHEIPLDKIQPDPDQPRKEFQENDITALALNIKKNGLIEPILVRVPLDDKYIIVDGERRYRAYKKLYEDNQDNESKKKWEKIRCLINENGSTIQNCWINLARTSYNPMETALAIAKLVGAIPPEDDNLDDGQKEKLKQSEVAKLLGKSPNNISEYISLMKLPESIREMALNESCVPFRILKSLATKTTLTDTEKDTRYKELHERFKNKLSGKSTKDREPSKTKETRRIESATKKISTTKEFLNKINVDELNNEDKVKKESRDDLKKSLQDIVETANALLKTMEE